MIKVIDIKGIKISSVNKKYVGRSFVLDSSYREFKELLSYFCKKVKIEKPYRVDIYFEMYQDIDNPIKCVLDSLGNCIENDRDVLELHVYKKKIKRGALGSVKVFARTLDEKEQRIIINTYFDDRKKRFDLPYYGNEHWEESKV